jgi:putative transposase
VCNVSVRGAGSTDIGLSKADTTVDFLLTARRDRKAALRFLRKAIRHNGTLEKNTIDKSCANRSKIGNTDNKAGGELRRVKYLNIVIEQDHRPIKRLVRPMLGSKSFWYAVVTLAAIELMHIVRKGQLLLTDELPCSAQQFPSLSE